MIDAPADLAGWVGALVLTVGGTAVVTRWLGKGDKEAQALRVVDADWRAEVKVDLKQLVQGVHALTSGQALLEQKVAGYDAKLAALEKRQEAQAEAHLKAVDALRVEFKRVRK